MWFDGIRQPNTLYVANTSRGKDSTAMLRAIQLMGWPLDMICSVDVWATDTIPAELPPMVAFKDEYDRKVLEWLGIPVTRLCATKRERTENGECHSQLSYERLFYDKVFSKKHGWHIKGFPNTNRSWCKLLKDQLDGRYSFQVDIRGHLLSQGNSEERERERESIAARQKLERKFPNLRIPDAVRQLVPIGSQTIGTLGFPNQACRWCTGELKNAASTASLCGRVLGVKTDSREDFWTTLSNLPQHEGQKINIVHYIGIAADEPKRIAKHMPKKDKVLPLVQIGWDEDLCGLEAKYMDMLSPTYTDGQLRDGCWFCHNQGVGQLRSLRKNYPDLWALLLKWDADSPVTFHADGHTVKDFDRRFALEDEGLVDPKEPWKWSKLEEELNYRWF